jgi:CRISPR-associated protein Csm5
VFDRWSLATLRDLAGKLGVEESNVRLPRYLASKSEEAVLGGGGKSRMRQVSAGDSAPVAYSGMKIYLLRTSTLIARGGGKFELGWKSARGSSDARRIDDSTPTFAEMAVPGTEFEGVWSEESGQDRGKMFQASNRYASAQLARHKEYARSTGLAPLAATVDGLEAKIRELEGRSNACVLSLGWGGGLLSKVAVGDTADAGYRSIVRHVSLYQRALQTGLPFPKTRRVVFQGGKAAQIPGWVLLEVA